MTGENLRPVQPTLNLTYVSYSDSHNVRRLASRLSDTSRLLTETDKEVKVLQQAREDLAKCVREQVPREDSLPTRDQMKDEVRSLIVLDNSDAHSPNLPYSKGISSPAAAIPLWKVM